MFASTYTFSMSIKDRIELDEDVRLPEWEFESEPSEHRWTTKDVGVPFHRTHQITTDGRLLEHHEQHESVEAEDDDSILPDRQLEVTDEWYEERDKFNRTITISTWINSEAVVYEARFLDGEVNRYVRVE